MIRKLAIVVAFGLALPASALACSDKHEQAKTSDGQEIVLAQADTSKPAKKAKKKSSKKSSPSKTDTTK
jgi:hypothetical protein